ncbi:chemotaxis protein MotA [Allochromatium warmingii]|uniref:Chemotaxis protein MotA n=1 Tax=Allochromatium warmingii TaxID=61595 RepID=A0A1H3C608_ALLWA|nr:flagellar motor protein PomA [Allochromatium warmingii]SDX49505.1 chemotaxis protein MotA [Allochromatium warmingii]
MDLATLLGLIGAVGVMIGAVVLGGDPVIFIDVPSIVIVFVGTAFVVLFRTTLSQFIGSFKVVLGAFLHKATPPLTLIEEAVTLANVARREGLLALEGKEISHPFLQTGITLCIDGHAPDVVQKVLSKDINLAIQRQEAGYSVFKATGEVAPAMGMIGTLIGLVQMLANMDDPKAIGPAMAVALLTTLYGAVLANAVAIPIAEKLKLRANEEKLAKTLILESISGIQEGLNPRVLEQLLMTYLPEHQRTSGDKG